MGPKQFHDVIMAFPETEFTTSYGQPAYKAFGKFLTRLRKEDDSVVLSQVSFDEREMLCEADPETFHFTDHYRNYPAVLARLKRLDAKTLRGYLTRPPDRFAIGRFQDVGIASDPEGRRNAPKTWLKAYDAGEPPPPFVKKAAKPRARKKTR